VVFVHAEQDCGCGGLPDTSPPSGWDTAANDARDSFYSGLDTPSGGDSGTGSPSGSSSGDSSGNIGSQSSGSSLGGDTGSGTGGSAGTFSDDAVLLTSRGLTLFRKGEFNNSLVLLNESLGLDPYSWKTWMARGDVLLALGQYEEAISAYANAIHLDPADPGAYEKTGDALVYEEKFDDAIVFYDHALAADPGRATVQANRTRAVDLAKGHTNQNATSGLPEVTQNTSEETPPANLTVDPVTPPLQPINTATKPAGLSLSVGVVLMALPIAGLFSRIPRRRT